MDTPFEKKALQVFANQLKEDLKLLEAAQADKSGNTKANVSLAAKWAPSEGRKYSKAGKFPSGHALTNQL